MAALTGGCACGRVRYECTAAPIVQLICHCRDCQRASGSAFAAILFVAADRLRFTGAEPRYHAVVAASGRHLARGFCPDCGAPVTAKWPGGVARTRLIQAASLDDPTIFRPQVEVWTSVASAWDVRHPDTEAFARGPSPEAVAGRVTAWFAAQPQ